jgi:hypothetical protein|tara:strand:+ start:469 stop:657 length:189 start_codon:yes stop_codon:yes gene_type:complete
MKKVILSSKNITTKQWSNLILELNLLRKAWKPYAKIYLTTPNLNKIISFGTKKHDLSKTEDD